LKSGPVAQLDTCLPAGREQQPISHKRKMYYVYVLKSESKNRFYIGISANLERRLKEHNDGKTKSTKHYRPWILVFSEIYENRILARVREKYLKSGSGREFIKNRAR
jgi:putative endonuclease